MAQGRALRWLVRGLQAAALVSIGAIVLDVIVTFATTVRYPVDDFCLAHARGAVTYDTRNRAANRPLPFFLVPSPIPTSSILDGPKATGLSVRYSRWHSGDLSYLDPAACPSTDSGLGLRMYPPQVLGPDRTPQSCPDLPYKQVFLPFPDEPLAGQVRILCDPDHVVPNCRMDDHMPNGWQAGITLPKTHLADWRAASAAARAYFTENLWDCGTD